MTCGVEGPRGGRPCNREATARVMSGSFDGAHYSVWVCDDHIDAARGAAVAAIGEDAEVFPKSRPVAQLSLFGGAA